MSKGYYTLTRITDYGPYVVKLILPVGGTVKAKDVSAEKFSVYVERMDDMGNILLYLGAQRRECLCKIPV